MDVMTSRLSLLGLFSMLCFHIWMVPSVKGGVVLSMRFLNFLNPRGLGDNGHCCDGKWGFCVSRCDHNFAFCMDSIHGSKTSTRYCRYGKQYSGEIPNVNWMQFTNRVGSLSNPVIWKMNAWPGSVLFKVYIEDVDPGSNKNDFVDFLIQRITMRPGTSRTITIRRRTRLNVELKLFCDANYFGQYCATYCVPSDSSQGHHTCDRSTGRKLCLPGWEGLKCNMDKNECVQSNCQNGATCVDGSNSYTCQCQTGYTGRYCELDVDECQNAMSCHFGNCTNTPGSFKCSCDAGYNGSHCDVDINECFSNPCQNGGNCVDLKGSYTCLCQKGYTGVDCSSDVNECDANPCFNNASCTNLVGGYRCNCLPGFQGDNCRLDVDECQTQSCNNGSCVNTPGSYECLCHHGFTGLACETDIDECYSPHPTAPLCRNNGTCMNSPGGYECQCADGYFGQSCQNDVDECQSNPCKNNGTCVNIPGEFGCDCVQGFKGPLCEDDIDECRLVGQPEPLCQNGGSCSNTFGGYRCECVDGYHGQDCAEDVDECTKSPCQNNASCINHPGSYFCFCTEGYSGKLCEDNIDECGLGICKNDGSCTDLNGSFLCKCTASWEGKTCEEDVNECLGHPCHNRGVCSNREGGFDCVCPDGWSGTLCLHDVDECPGEPCQNGATCVNEDGGFFCDCAAGWEGPRCVDDVDECEEVTCSHIGVCRNTIGSFHCACPEGRTGKLCETEVDACENVTCANNGVCFSSLGKFYCSCANGWRGKLCDEDIDECAEYTDICYSTTISMSATPGHVVCVNAMPGFECMCAPEWKGHNCDISTITTTTTTTSATITSTTTTNPATTTNSRSTSPGLNSQKQGEEVIGDGSDAVTDLDPVASNVPGDRVSFYVVCNPIEDIRNAVNQAIGSMLKHFDLYKEKTFSITHTETQSQNDDGQRVIWIEPVVKVDGVQMTNGQLRQLLQTSSGPLPGFTCPGSVTQNAPVASRNSQGSQDAGVPGWLAAPIILVILLIIIIIAIIVTVAFRRRRNSLKVSGFPSNNCQVTYSGVELHSNDQDSAPIVSEMDDTDALSITNPNYNNKLSAENLQPCHQGRPVLSMFAWFNGGTNCYLHEASGLTSPSHIAKPVELDAPEVNSDGDIVEGIEAENCTNESKTNPHHYDVPSYSRDETQLQEECVTPKVNDHQSELDTNRNDEVPETSTDLQSGVLADNKYDGLPYIDDLSQCNESP